VVNKPSADHAHHVEVHKPRLVGTDRQNPSRDALRALDAGNGGVAVFPILPQFEPDQRLLKRRRITRKKHGRC
jgi:hypothetical protein